MEAVDRFYRLYSKYLESYDSDSLFNLLNSLHSLGDKLKTDNDIDLLKLDEFVTLKTIRNHLHHQTKMRNIFTTIPVDKISGIHTDMVFMCLLYTSDINDSIEEVSNKYRSETKDIINNTVHFYGDVVNISHVIFNMAARLMVLLDKNNIVGISKGYLENYKCMMFDINNGHSITVSGKIYSNIGNVGTIDEILLNTLKSNK
ncbi:hypothetical protein [uncultured Gammaproteobacteria bacterium]|uniref:hypothetical protein n=1 Tax=Bathymodiolus heckerae thiotrophic gill symbiont TaxID=1052212 RepID=UPI0010B60635|nr:hypothetical protein [Bathymodiolus heckerae thiotrophic gill symbiont]CAC9595159.1 hypothetical protein [uncultured Gammaproteobacteria bacterium]SHN90123.1 hypothetical protein BHECKSOX_320 [Bathymodiolus heckerae thiotrophic gill symbiont]